jgi:hypothetical protein
MTTRKPFKTTIEGHEDVKAPETPDSHPHAQLGCRQAAPGADQGRPRCPGFVIPSLQATAHAGFGPAK